MAAKNRGRDADDRLDVVAAAVDSSTVVVIGLGGF